MKEFRIFVHNKPGELARVTEALAASAVNIKAIASEASTDRSFLRIVTTDATTTERALKTAGFGFDLNETLDIELMDRPGELAKIARRLARQGINVESIYILSSKNGKTQIAMTVSDLERAKSAVK